MKKVYISIVLLILILFTAYSDDSLNILSELQKASQIEDPFHRLKKYDSIMSAFELKPETHIVDEADSKIDNKTKLYTPEKLLEFKKENTSAAYDSLLNSMSGEIVHWSGIVDDVKTSDSTSTALMDYFGDPYISIRGEGSFLPDYSIDIYGDTNFINSLRIGDKIKYSGKIVWVYDMMLLSIHIVASNIEKL